MKYPFRQTVSLLIVLPMLAAVASARSFLPELVKRIKPSAVAIETFDAKGNTVSRGSGFFVAAGQDRHEPPRD